MYVLADGTDRTEEPLEHLMHVLGVLRLRQPRVAAQVGKENGDGAALSLGGIASGLRHGCRHDRERPAAAAAELFAVLIRESAGRAGDRQRGAALRTKPPARAVFRGAIRADLLSRGGHC